MGAQRNRDEAHDDARRGGAAPGTCNDGLDRATQVEPAGNVERRSPADLDVTRAVRGDVLDKLVGDALDRGRVLHQRDRQVEGSQQLRLVGDLGGRLQAARHRVEIHALVEAAFPRQLERGRRSERAVEVQMQLGLGHPREKVGRAHDPIVRQSTAPERT